MSSIHADVVGDASPSSVVIMDWDGTLCPTPHIRSALYRVANNPTQKKRLYAFMDDTGAWLARLMAYLVSIDTMSVFIVTDSPSGWVLELAQAFFPAILPYLSHERVTIMHTSHINASHAPSMARMSPLERVINSKLPAFKSCLFRHTQLHANRPRLISIGDSMVEHLAASECRKEGLVSEVQIVRFQQGLNLAVWQQQMVTLQALLTSLLQKTHTTNASKSHRFELSCRNPARQWVSENKLPGTTDFTQTKLQCHVATAASQLSDK